jgi:MurNAc alpha-1-phosphate uridylyltransferase
MVLAAGLGLRMRPLTNDRPKALVEVGGRALIDHMLGRLAEAGVAEAVVNVHAFADGLEGHLGARKGPPRVIVSDERDALLETGGGVKKARPLLGEGPIFIGNVDSVWISRGAPALVRLGAAFDPGAMGALLLLTPTAAALGFDGPGDFFMDAEGRLTPRRGRGFESAPFAYCGVHVADPQPIYACGSARFGLFPLWAEMAAAGRLYGQVLDGDWMHVGDPLARDAAEARLAAAAAAEAPDGAP